MKKTICFILMIAIISTCFFACIPREEDLGTMVYASPEEQNEVYELIMKNISELDLKYLTYYDLAVVKESITPLYYIDMIEYAKTGNLKISRRRYSLKGKIWEGYVAKTITADDKFGGNLYFYVCGNMINVHGDPCSPHWDGPLSAESTDFHASCSYADHAERIRLCLGKSEIIPAENVRFLNNDSTGMFYIKDGDNEYFIPGGYETSRHEMETDVVLSISDMEALAQEYLRIENENRKANEEFQKTHPGEQMIGMQLPPTVGGLCSRIDNIINIYEYLGIEATAATEEKGN